MRNYLDGPHSSTQDIYTDGYRGDDDPAEAAGTLASAIDHWFCGPFDDGDEGQEWILTNTLERAARFIAAQPCTCTEDLCPRCMALGCDYSEHKTDLCGKPDPAVLAWLGHGLRDLGNAVRVMLRPPPPPLPSWVQRMIERFRR